MNFDGILNQVFQPYFYYSIIFLIASFVSIKVLTRYCGFMGQKTKSLLYLAPLAVPIIVMLIFSPSINIQAGAEIIKAGTTVPGSTGSIASFAGTSAMLMIPPRSFMFAMPVETSPVYSVTGLLCLIGLAAGSFFALSMLASDDRVARKVLHVIPLSPNEHQWLQTKVAELSSKLSIAPPKIGLVEDLRPNAFTIGYGENSTIVFSVGLLNSLYKEEVVAVAAHELAHVKNFDFFYKTVSSTLTIISFFNPVAYIASSTGQREREMLADERAIQLLEKPAALANALAKICNAIQNLPKENTLASFSSNLLVSSSVLHRVGILSTHPRLDKRLRVISEPKPKTRLNYHNIGLAVFISMLLVCSTIAVGLATINLQTGYTASHQVITLPTNFKGTDFTTMGPNTMAFSSPVTANFNGARIVNTSMHHATPALSNGTLYVVVGNGTAVYLQPHSVDEFFVALPENASFDP